MTQNKYLVEVNYQSLAGNPLGKRYQINAKDPDSALSLALQKVKKLKNWAKTYGATIDLPINARP